MNQGLSFHRCSQYKISFKRPSAHWPPQKSRNVELLFWSVLASHLITAFERISWTSALFQFSKKKNPYELSFFIGFLPSRRFKKKSDKSCLFPKPFPIWSFFSVFHQQTQGCDARSAQDAPHPSSRAGQGLSTPAALDRS